MDKDMFSQEFIDSLNEKAGGVLLKKDLREERHSMKKTEEDTYQDYVHNINHPFMAILVRDAKYHAEHGLPFVAWRRIFYLIEKEGSDAWTLYYNDGDVWRQSANALVWKHLKEIIPGLITPRMKFGCKGEAELLEANPGKFMWLREIHKARMDKENEGKE